MIKIIITYLVFLAFITLSNPPGDSLWGLSLFLLLIMLHLAVRENALTAGFKIGADFKEKLMLAWLQMHLDKDTIEQIATTAKAEIEIFKKTGKDVIIPLTKENK